MPLFGKFIFCTLSLIAFCLKWANKLAALYLYWVSIIMGNLKPKLHIEPCLIALPLSSMCCKPRSIHVQYLMFNDYSNMLGTRINCFTKWKYFHYKNTNIIVTLHNSNT